VAELQHELAAAHDALSSPARNLPATRRPGQVVVWRRG
jgi:hypothetical protein